MVEKDGSAKGIVFSQFTSFLDISRFEYTQMNKSSDNEGTQWTGKCWYVYNLLKYEQKIRMHGLTYSNLFGKSLMQTNNVLICLIKHVWSYRPRFGMAHALCLGLAPWLAAFMLIRIAHGFSFLYEVYEKRIVAEAGCFTVS
ncbi:ubiquitin-fold modifier-conjugating enzyme 1-like [Pyrus ussuriensis x Pyrus communis]|uniref:Ubiquitin-fold modifier-conjugating enzyme 1 n=1 Tax=Pyrus ussuriensis x Pyrus communis TaxID=2448454 RepID=A0A5N5I3F9_9ROSA|nr:ubiquitin-fold modifier-conjugating enzyme 1-like [Pyrus ussuriensis x Pyrus communis]